MRILIMALCEENHHSEDTERLAGSDSQTVSTLGCFFWLLLPIFKSHFVKNRDQKPKPNTSGTGHLVLGQSNYDIMTFCGGE